MARMLLIGPSMSLPNSPPLSSSDVLEALGLERRRSRGQELLVAMGLAAAGMLVGAGAVLVRLGVVSLATPKVAEPQP